MNTFGKVLFFNISSLRYLSYKDLPMYQMQYILPENFPVANGSLDPTTARLASTLKGVDKNGAYVPNSALWVKLDIFLEGASLEIKKRESACIYQFLLFRYSKRAAAFNNRSNGLRALPPWNG